MIERERQRQTDKQTSSVHSQQHQERKRGSKKATNIIISEIDNWITRLDEVLTVCK